MTYIIHNLEQRSQEWLDFRKDKITASMIPAIMNESKWETPLQIYHRILNGKEVEVNHAMEDGNRIEKEALEWFNSNHVSPYDDSRLHFKDSVISFVENPDFMASLDGFNGKIHCEIKRANKEDHALAKQKIMPLHYKGQFQWTLYLLGQDFGWYVSWMPGDPYAFQSIVDWEYQEKMLISVNDFKRRLIDLDPPPATDSDVKIIDDPESIKEAEEYYDICEEIDCLNGRKEELKKSLLAKHSVKNCRAAKVAINSTRRSWIDYESIPELQGVNLEKYRKTGEEIWTLRRIKTS